MKFLINVTITLAVGVYETGTKQFELISSGDLPEAVAASCAIPYVFQPVPSKDIL